jgi:hypothetical protein
MEVSFIFLMNCKHKKKRRKCLFLVHIHVDEERHWNERAIDVYDDALILLDREEKHWWKTINKIRFGSQNISDN